MIELIGGRALYESTLCGEKIVEVIVFKYLGKQIGMDMEIRFKEWWITGYSTQKAIFKNNNFEEEL